MRFDPPPSVSRSGQIAATAAIGAIVKGVAAGDLAPGEAKALVSLVEAALRGHELVDHERRLTALELKQ